MTDLDQTPIPPEALRGALDELIDRGVIEKKTRNRGVTWLAERVDVSPRTVGRWLSGDRSLGGARAVAVRSVLENHLE